MAGHSQFKNIMHRKGRQDAAKSKLFGKLAREITVAAKLGVPDPEMNPRLRAAMLAARAENMPKDNIERAIKKALDSDGESYEAIRYEGYGPGGVAVIVEVLTTTATAPRARCAQASPNPAAIWRRPARCRSCSTMSASSNTTPRRRARRRCSRRRWKPAPTTWSRPGRRTRFTPRRIISARSPRRWSRNSAIRARPLLTWRPQNTVAVDDEQGEKVLKLIENLNEQDDVQNVYANFDISDALVSRMSA